MRLIVEGGAVAGSTPRESRASGAVVAAPPYQERSFRQE
jgi:hypothetical protein